MMNERALRTYFPCLQQYGAVIVFMLFDNAAGKVSRVVRIDSGYVRGYQDPQFEIFAFCNIPYATVPTGPNKFKAPLPAPVWLDTFEAVDKGVICPQHDFHKGTTKKEDCLIANVYVPDTYATSLPVMVHVHGGGHQNGYGARRKHKHLVHSKRIIVVNFNYRLGAHGFLCLGTRDVPGNAGMKDIVALLQWVKRNIARFGGNPEEVTIDGYSSGASFADLLVLSKTARGLFNKVVSESGAALAVWSVQMRPLDIAKNYAKQFDFPDTNDIYELEEFYKKLDFERLNSGFSYNQDHTFKGFSPCVERPTGGEMVFLDDAPINIMKRGDYVKVPTLYSITSNEHSLDTQKTLEKSGFPLPADLQFKSKPDKENVTRELSKFYSKDEAINYVGDVEYTYPVLRAIKLHIEAGHSQVYFYVFAYPGDNTHCGQTYTIADYTLDEKENSISKEYKQIKAIVREIMLNFVTSGAPVRAGSALPAWGPVASSEGGPHLAVGAEPRVRVRWPPPQARRARFWHALYAAHYRAPAPPPGPPSPVPVMRRL